MANSGDSEQLYAPSANQEDSFYDSIGDATSPEYDNAVNTSMPSPPIDPEEKARQEEEWKKELAKLEDEILTLRQVLSAKVRQSGELKRKLGITPMVELKHDLKQGITNIRETDAYQKTNQTLKNVGQKTSSTFSAIGSFTSRKIGDMRNSNAFKSFEEKVGGAVSNVKDYVVFRKSTSEDEGKELTPQNSASTDSGFNSPAEGDKTPLIAAAHNHEDAKAPK